jgi:3-phenylpropionate/cinnamic acid dioxygenase small subunit
VDGYHAGFVHESAFATFARFGISRYAQRPPIKREGLTRRFPGGHSTLEGGYEDGRGKARSLPQLYQEYLDQLTQRHGAERARDIVSNHHLCIFPHVYLCADFIRVIQPIALEETESYSHPFRLGGVPDEFSARRLYEVTCQLSTTGLVNPADLEMFMANQTGLHARHMEWLVLSRGMDQETVLPSGERIGRHADEVPQRAFYRSWREAMPLFQMRVHHLLHERNFAQSPPSRTVHQVSNVQVWSGDREDEARVRCNVVVHEIRVGDHLQFGLGQQRVLAGKCEYRLRYQDGWRIACKKVVLINRHMPIVNLSFLI